MASNIFGGFTQLIYTSETATGTATPVGITTRLNPILDTSNINVRGTGRRGLYDILLGMRQPQLTMDILPIDIDFIKDYQDSQTPIPYLHYRDVYADKGLTFTDAVFNRTSVEARHNEAITATIEVWAKTLTDLEDADWGSFTGVKTPYRWLHSELWLSAEKETQWWSWRYEVNYNLQRLGNVASGYTRAVKTRQVDVTGLIVKDLESFDEWWQLMTPRDKFNITIKVDGDTGPGTGSVVDLLNQNACRWGRLEAPVGPEDLQAKRFPFTAINYA